jgi:SH3-like domain-containing protein
MSIADLRAFVLSSLLLAVSASATPASAEENARRDTPSGLPVPRFVSLRYSETNCRSGPSFEHPVAFKFMRAGAPVMIVAETRDHWRKIRDSEGSECWAHQTTLAARNHVLVLRETPLRARPSSAAAVKARLAPGLLAEFESAERDFARVKAAGVSGWAETDALWGVDVAARN